ncbi:MAG: type II secretion system protein GspK [Synergistes sp.]|nr:type II secretion system protein GspK [Synergistes sp.]
MARRSSGFILVSVMLTVTLLITSATAFAWFARNEAYRAAARENILRFRSAAEIAVSEIAKSIAEDKNGYDAYTEVLYSPYQRTKIDVGNYTFTAQIKPLNDKISTDGLFLPDGITLRSEYEYAWSAIWDELKHPELAEIVLDFMSKSSKQRLGGSSRQENINRPITDLTELKAVKEIDNKILWGTKEFPVGLADYTDVIGGQKLNFNIAKPEVIAKLDSDLSLELAKSIATYRLTSPFKSLEDLRRVPGFPAALSTKLANIIGFESTYFMLIMKGKDGSGSQRNFKVIITRGGAVQSWEE